MTEEERVKRAAQEIREAFHASRPSIALPGNPPETAAAELESIIADAVRSHIADAYAEGKADGLRESEAKEQRVFELGKAEGRKEALDQG